MVFVFSAEMVHPIKKARSGGADRKGIIFKTKADYRRNRDIATTPVTTHFYAKGIYIITIKSRPCTASHLPVQGAPFGKAQWCLSSETIL